jgi:hypothetical protein
VGSGNYPLRLEPATLEAVRKAASSDGVSVNTWLRQAIEAKLEGGGMPSSVTREAALRQLSEVALQLSKGFVLVPGSEAPGSSWDSLMGGSEK